MPQPDDALVVPMSRLTGLLDYLVGVAQETQGAEVWRALFSEMRESLVKEMERLKERLP